MPDLTANTHTELFLKAIAEGSTSPEGLVPENHLELWLQQIMEMGGVSGNYVRYTEQELSAAEEAQARDNIGAAGMEDLAPAYDSTIPYKVGNLLTYLGKQYEVTGDDGVAPPVGTLPTDTDYFTERPVSEIIDMIKNGTIVTGHSAVADNLTPYSEDSGTTQENPFISQGTGTDNNSVIVTTGTIARQLEKQGNTVPVMQLFRNTNVAQTTVSGLTITRATDAKKIHITGTATAIVPFTIYSAGTNVGHKYFVRTASTKIYALFFGATGIQSNIGVITPVTNSALVAYIAEGTTFDEDIEFDIFDITGWNSDIITDLTSHPEHFSWYYNGSMSYDAGSLQNCNGRYLECGQGRNLFDPSTIQNGYIADTDGVFHPNDNDKSTDYILVIPNKPIYIFTEQTVYAWGAWYDKDKNFISGISGYSYSVTRIKTAPPNAVYARFTMTHGNDGNVNTFTVSLYYTPEEGGEGYNQHYDYVAPIRIDTGNETLKAFDKKLPSGVITRATLTKTLNGTEEWNAYTPSGTTEVWYYVENAFPNSVENTNDVIIKSNRFDTKPNIGNSSDLVAYGTGKLITTQCLTSAGNIFRRVWIHGFESVDALKTDLAANNVHLEYKSVETTEQGTPYSEYADINDYSYMAWFDTDGNLVSIPQGCKLFYPVDYKGFTDDLVMYTNGDATALAKNESITDTALNARGYYKMQVLLSPLTDASGLTYDIKEAMKIGNLVSLTIRATNLAETSISSGDPLFTLASDLIPAGTIKAYANVAGSVVSCTISNLGSVSVDAAIAQNETVAIILTYAV